jgi:membrane glycosyltransferase
MYFITNTNHKILVMKKKKFCSVSVLFCSVLFCFCSVLFLNGQSQLSISYLKNNQLKNLSQLKKEAITTILTMSNNAEFKSLS